MALAERMTELKKHGRMKKKKGKLSVKVKGAPGAVRALLARMAASNAREEAKEGETS